MVVWNLVVYKGLVIEEGDTMICRKQEAILVVSPRHLVWIDPESPSSFHGLIELNEGSGSRAA